MECRKHSHGGNKGVCASCLREKLSKLPHTTSYYIIHRSDSFSTTVSTSSPSSPPIKENHQHRRGGSMSMTFAMSGSLIEGLKKSRSMAHVPRDSFFVKDSETKKKSTEKLKSATVKKKTGFWTKLLHLKGKGGGGGGGCGDGELVNSRQKVC